MVRFLALSVSLAAAAPALAQSEPGEPPVREAQITVYGSDPCPRSTDEEIVVCHRRPEEERYRIPRPLRRGSRPAEQSWGARVETLDEVSRDTRPNSCSVVGSYGQSGCAQAMIRQWFDARRARRVGP